MHASPGTAKPETLPLPISPLQFREFSSQPAGETVVKHKQSAGAATTNPAATPPVTHALSPHAAMRKLQGLLDETPRQARHDDDKGNQPTFFVETRSHSKLKLANTRIGQCHK